MNLLTILLINLGVVLACTFVLWLLSLPLRDASIIDLFWGTGFVVIAWVSASLGGFASHRAILIVILATLWGARLTGYLSWRNIGSGEDFRYREMRDHWREKFPIVSLFTVFWFQAIIMWIVSMPLQVAAKSEAGLNWLDAVGLLLWATGLFFETVGDWQLARFKANPENQGKVMDSGLWRYTRHPNYFGDFLIWWGFYAIALAGGFSWVIFSPLVMTLFLMRISGATLLEKTLPERRSGYREYMQRTSPFFPWWPKAKSG